MQDDQDNGRLTKYRVEKLEAAVRDATEAVHDMELKLDRYCLSAEQMSKQLGYLEARLGVTETRVTDLRIEFAKWAAGGGLIGGTLSAVLIQLLQHLLP